MTGPCRARNSVRRLSNLAGKDVESILKEQFNSDKSKYTEAIENPSFVKRHSNSLLQASLSFFGIVLAAQLLSIKYQNEELQNALYDTEERLINVEAMLTSQKWSDDLAARVGAKGRGGDIREAVKVSFLVGGKAVDNEAEVTGSSSQGKVAAI